MTERRRFSRILHQAPAKIDIESISQLKRFIELNVGNNDLLNRELEHLSGF